MAVWCLELLLFLPTPPLLAGDAGTWAVGGGGAVFPSLWHHLTRGVPRRGLPTDRYMWSDATGLQECTKASTKPPSLQWTWVSPGLGVGRRLWSGVCPNQPTCSSRFLTGSWISASPAAQTQRGGSTLVTSPRERLSLSLGRGPQGGWAPAHQAWRSQAKPLHPAQWRRPFTVHESRSDGERSLSRGF